MKRSSDDTMNASDSGERSKQVQFTQDMVMKKTHTTAVVIQEATAIIAVEETTTNPEVTATHEAEATTAMAGVEETTPATTTEMAIAIQEAKHRHLRGPEEEVIEAMIDNARGGYLKRVTVKQFDAEGKEIYREDRDYGEPGYNDQGYYGNGEQFPMDEVE